MQKMPKVSNHGAVESKKSKVKVKKTRPAASKTAKTRAKASKTLKSRKTTLKTRRFTTTRKPPKPNKKLVSSIVNKNRKRKIPIDKKVLNYDHHALSTNSKKNAPMIGHGTSQDKRNLSVEPEGITGKKTVMQAADFLALMESRLRNVPGVYEKLLVSLAKLGTPAGDTDISAAVEVVNQAKSALQDHQDLLQIFFAFVPQWLMQMISQSTLTSNKRKSNSTSVRTNAKRQPPRNVKAATASQFKHNEMDKKRQKAPLTRKNVPKAPEVLAKTVLIEGSQIERCLQSKHK